ncbi:MAG: MATE family efflux transporter [Lachnospira pectinoschiza]
MIIGFKWYVAGAAVATVLGNIFSTVFYIIHLTSKRSILSIKPKDYSAKKIITLGVLSIGIPASLNSILMSFSNIMINSFMAKHGDLQLAGLGVAMKVNMIAVMLLIGVGTGIQPLLGYCFGAGNSKRYRSVLKFSLCFAICLSIIMTLICYLGAAPLAKAFLDDEEAFGYAFAFSRIYIMSGRAWNTIRIHQCNTVNGCCDTIAYTFSKPSGNNLFSDTDYNKHCEQHAC